MKPLPPLLLVASLMSAASPSIAQDWEAFKSGTRAEVEAAVALLPKETGLETRGPGFATPLQIAAGSNPHPEVVLLLIESGAELEVDSDLGGLTPLMRALDNANPEVVLVLLKAGAGLEARDNHSRTPLMRAAIYNNANPDVISMLLKAGADLEARDTEAWTPLMRAVIFNANPEVISVLL